MPTSECPICYLTQTQLVELPCKHQFCEGCITKSLQLRQQCPLCRRICCVPLNEPFRYTNNYQIEFQKNIEYTKFEEDSEQSSLPCMIFDQKISFNTSMEFNFYQPRDIHMINLVLNHNLQLCGMSSLSVSIDDEIEYCVILQLVGVKPVINQLEQSYSCVVKNVGRAQVHQKEYRQVELDNNPLLFISFTLIEDLQSIQVDSTSHLLTDIEEIIDVIVQNSEDPYFVEMINLKDQIVDILVQYTKQTNKTFSSASMISLSLIQLLRLSKMNYKKLYYGVSIEERLKVTLKHIKALDCLVRDQV